jgi:hypothetical protein
MPELTSAYLVKDVYEDSATRAAAQAVMDAIDGPDGYIVDHAANSTKDLFTWLDVDDSHGVGIVSPGRSRSIYNCENIGFACQTQWSTLPGGASAGAAADAGSAWGALVVEYVAMTNASAPDDPRPPPLQSPASPAAASTLAWSFAEGYTASSFDQYLTLLNPTERDATVRVTYFLRASEPVVRSVRAPANARTTIAVHGNDPGVGRNQEVATLVEPADGAPIVAERPMYFRYADGVDGGHTALGSIDTATTWYFAEGYTGADFDEYLTIMNPSHQDARLRITYYLARGPPVIKEMVAPARRRTTVVVHESAQGVGRGQEVAAKVEVTNGVGVVAERPMYFRYADGVDGGHIVVGATAPRRAWHFAEGYTGAGFDQYLTILNPNDAPASVTITYFLASGAPVEKTLVVPATARRTVVVHDAREGVGRGREVSARVTTTHPDGIVVERPMYFSYGSGITGGHNVMGAPDPRQAWYFAEGYTGPGFDEYLTITNPSARDAEVSITYYLKSGAPVVKRLTARANARMTVVVHEAAQGVGRGQEVAAKVESTNGVGIVVERPMYFVYGDNVDGGHNVMGFAP